MLIKKQPLITGIFLLLLVFSASMAQARILDRIVATVNGEIITLSELNEKLERIMQDKQSNFSGSEDELRRQILEAMIFQILTIQEGERLGITASDQEVEETLERIRTSNQLTKEQFEERITSQGGKLEDFKKEVKNDLIKNKIIRVELASFIVVSEDNIDEFINQGGVTAAGASAEPGDSGPKVHIRNIFFSLPARAAQEDIDKIMAKAEKAADEIKNGLDFSEAATRYSEAPNAKSGGDLGQINLKDISETVRNTINGLDEGQASRPINLGDSIQIFQLVQRIDTQSKKTAKNDDKKNEAANRPGTPEEREKARRIISEKMLEKKYEEWLQDLRKKAIIKVNL